MAHASDDQNPNPNPNRRADRPFVVARAGPPAPPRPLWGLQFGVRNSTAHAHSCLSLLRIRIRIRAGANHDLTMRCDAPGSGAWAALVGWLGVAVGPRKTQAGWELHPSFASQKKKMLSQS